MEAKDTVMKGNITSLTEQQQKIVDKLLQAQAEISFKAGMKEVVEWVDPHLQNLGSRDFEPSMWVTISERDWQAKLKEWGVK